MLELARTLDELESLHKKAFGRSLPEVIPDSFLPFPAGVDPIEHARTEAREVAQLLERVAFAPRPDAWVPPADSFVGDHVFLVRIEIPGVSREDVDVHVVGRECIVRGERKPPHVIESMRAVGLERPWGKFERRFILPTGARIDEISARCVDGVLELKIPAQSAGLPEEQRIEVS